MEIKSKLNEKQYLSCASTSKYLRIIAGAGTGKTRTLTYRLAYLISLGMEPKRILAITFTRKAADEMKTRVKDLLQENDIEMQSEPYINNFHGFCYRFLKKEIINLKIYDRNFQIVDEEDRGQILKDIFKEMSKGSSKDFTSAIMSRISSLKNDGISIDDMNRDDVTIGEYSSYSYDDLYYVYSKYEQYLKRQNLLDFDDLLLYTLKILKEFPQIREYYANRYDMIFVDEFQDTNSVQYTLLKLLVGPNTCLTVVGDPDQTIYTWRGAQNDIIKDRLQRDYPSLETIVLDDNYRSTQAILDLSNMLIKNNRDRLDKSLKAASNINGEKPIYHPCLTPESEGEYIASTIYKLVSSREYKYSDIAVLYRANRVSQAIERAFPRYSIPYSVYGGMKFYERAEIKDLLAYLRTVFTHDDLSFRRILKFPTRGVGETSLEKAKEIAQKMNDEDGNLYTVFLKHSSDIKLTSVARSNLDKLFSIVQKYEKIFNSYNDKPDEIMTYVHSYLEETHFFEEVRNEDIKANEKSSYTDRTSSSKTDNVNELLNMLNTYLQTDELDEDGNIIGHTLSDFLIMLALESSQDKLKDENKVTLMTSHVSKGLEYKVVFIAGLSEQIFPSVHAINGTVNQMEEERRLMYVSITRAQERLYLTYRGGRDFSGNFYTPSRFLKEIGFKNTIIGEDRNNSSNYNVLEKLTRNYDNSTKVSEPVKKDVYNSNLLKSQEYKVGDEIIHTTYKEGKVINVEKRNDGRLFLTIIFNDIDGEKNVCKKLIPNALVMRKVEK